MAMLAKQAWRFIKNPDCSCVEAKAKEVMSYTWRSILSGMQLVKEGMIWRIGSGVKIHIWDDLWIPRAWTCRPCTPRGRVLMHKVSDLINPITGTWDEDLVWSIFCVEDAKLIMAMPVFAEWEDHLAWHYNKKGAFSVKSAYKLFADKQRMESRTGRASVSTDGGGDEVMWRNVWSFPIPNRLKHFMWRLAHNTLAVRGNLAHREMKICTKCVVCNRDHEDGGHLLFKCKSAKAVWCMADVGSVRSQLVNHRSAREVVISIMASWE